MSVCACMLSAVEAEVDASPTPQMTMLILLISSSSEYLGGFPGSCILNLKKQKQKGVPLHLKRLTSLL